MITVGQFRRLPKREDVQLELRAGRVVAMPRSTKRHDDSVHRVHRWLIPFADPLGFLMAEFTYRPLAEYELRVADLAYVLWPRWEAVDDDDTLHGAPDFAVEVASPSNSAHVIPFTVFPGHSMPVDAIFTAHRS